jgi:hypothetical protein
MIAPVCKKPITVFVSLSMGRRTEDTPHTTRRTNDRYRAHRTSVRHATFAGSLIDHSADGIKLESKRGLRPGASYRLELSGEIEMAVPEAVVRWCRLCSVSPGAIEGDFEPVFRAGLEFAVPLSKTAATVLGSQMIQLLPETLGTPAAPSRPAHRSRITAGTTG